MSSVTRSHVKHWTALKIFPSNIAEMMLTNWTGGFGRTTDTWWSVNVLRQQLKNVVIQQVTATVLQLPNMMHEIATSNKIVQKWYYFTAKQWQFGST